MESFTVQPSRLFSALTSQSGFWGAPAGRGFAKMQAQQGGERGRRDAKMEEVGESGDSYGE